MSHKRQRKLLVVRRKYGTVLKTDLTAHFNGQAYYSSRVASTRGRDGWVEGEQIDGALAMWDWYDNNWKSIFGRLWRTFIYWDLKSAILCKQLLIYFTISSCEISPIIIILFADSDRTCDLICMGHTWSIHFNRGWSQRWQMWERSQLKEVITRRDLSVCKRCQSPVGQASLTRIQAAMTRVKCDEWPRKYQLLQQNPVTLVKLFLVEVSWDSFFTPSWQQIMSDVFSAEMNKCLLLTVRHVPDYLFDWVAPW